MASVAQANIFSWAVGASGTTNTAVNWSPNGVPGANDDTRYWQNASYGITVWSPADTALTVWMSNAGTPKFVGGTLRVRNGFTVDGNSATSITGGFVRAGWFSIGPGSLTVTGGSTQASTTTASATSYVGTASGFSSALTVGSGASFQCGALVVPEIQGATGTLTVTGHPIGQPGASLRVTYAGAYSTYQGDIVIGSQGTGDAEFSNGGYIHTDGDLLVGTDGTGTVHLFHSGLSNTGVPTLDVHGFAYVASNDYYDQGGNTDPAGSGVLSIAAGTASVGGMFLGDQSGSGGGKLLMTGGTLTVNNGLVMSNANDGLLDLRGGTVRVYSRDSGFYYNDFSTVLHQSTPITISSSVGSPVLDLLSGTNEFYASTPTVLAVGRGGAGTLHVAGTSADIHGNTVVADSVAGTGILQADDGGFNFNGTLAVGPGNGAVTVRAGGINSYGETDLMAGATTGARFTVTDYSQAYMKGLMIGGTNSAATPGNVVATVDSGSTLGDSGPATRVWKNAGHLVVADSSSVFLSNLSCSGEVALRSGNVTATTVRLFDTGTLHGMGRVAGAVSLDDASAELAILSADPAGGTLTVGDSTLTTGFLSSGLTRVEQDTLVLLCKGGAPLGHMQLAGGTLRLPNGGTVRTGDLLEGGGRVEGNVLNQGTVTANSGTAYLDVAGHLTSLTGAITGPGLEVLAGGRLSARGTVAGTVRLGGTLDMGPAPALLTLQSVPTFLPADTLTMRIGSRASGLQDTLAVGTAVTLQGDLDLRTIAGHEPVAGDTLTLITASSITGTFGRVTLDGVVAPGIVQPIYEATRVRLSVLRNTTDVPPYTPPGPPLTLRLVAIGAPRDASLELDLPTDATVRADLIDVAGRRVTTLTQGVLAPGRHRFALNASLMSGVYFARVDVADAAGAHLLTARVVRVR